MNEKDDIMQARLDRANEVFAKGVRQDWPNARIAELIAIVLDRQNKAWLRLEALEAKLDTEAVAKAMAIDSDRNIPYGLKERLPRDLSMDERMASPGCRAARDGDCIWTHCPQLRDGEPKRTGRHCPLDTGPEDYE